MPGSRQVMCGETCTFRHEAKRFRPGWRNVAISRSNDSSVIRITTEGEEVLLAHRKRVLPQGIAEPGDEVSVEKLPESCEKDNLFSSRKTKAKLTAQQTNN